MKVTRHRRHDAAPPTTAKRRYDRFDLLPPVQRADGMWMTEGRIARPGIYEYENHDGSIRRELVPPKTLADPDWLRGVAHSTMTYPHPPAGTMVTPENVQKYGVGNADGQPDITELQDKDGNLLLDGGYVKIKMIARRKDAIDAMRHHDATQLSPGYDVDCVDVADGGAASWLKANGREKETPGVDPHFGRYDAIQIKRYQNHIALVPAARGGPGCSLRADGNAVVPSDPVSRGVPMDPTLLASLLALNIPGLSRADAETLLGRADGALMAKQLTEAHEALEAEKAEHTKTKGDMSAKSAACDAIQKTLDGMNAERRAMEVDVPPADQKMDAAGKPIPETLRSLSFRYAEARRSRLALAATHKVTVTDAMSVSEIEKAIVAKIDAKAPTTEHVSYYRATCDRLDAVKTEGRSDAAEAWGLPKVFKVDTDQRIDGLPPAPAGDPWTVAHNSARHQGA